MYKKTKRNFLKLSGMMIAFILVCSSCTAATGSSDTASPTQTTPSSSSNGIATAASATAAPVNGTFDSIYDAYYQKYAELVSGHSHGGGWYPQLADTTVGSWSFSYITDMCIADLMDFNGDGTQDLFVIYFNGQYTGKNIVEVPIPQAGSYEIEIWTYVGGVLSQLLHETQVSNVADNCYATVFENAAGRPVIQLYSEDDTSCAYANIYYKSGTLVKDELTYKNQVFKLNGTQITADAWNQNVAGYCKILLSAFLASPSYSSKDLLTNFGIDYNTTIAQTGKFCDALSQREQPPAFQLAEGDYIPLYLQKIDEMNRSSLDAVSSGQSIGSYSYGLYDIDGNGMPELIMNDGHECTVYAIENGSVVQCGDEFSVLDATLTVNGASGMVLYFGRMDNYVISKITLQGTAPTVKEVASGSVTPPGSGYPDLKKFKLGDYNTDLCFCYAPIPSLLYTYNQ